MRKNDLKSLDEFIGDKFGYLGSRDRNEFERGFEAFYLGYLIQEARHKKQLSKEEVAKLSGTAKSYISKLEKGLKNPRYSTLQRIIKEGLGGQLKISIELGQDNDTPF